jgi:tetratricopeptide (TPR) repeat protein
MRGSLALSEGRGEEALSHFKEALRHPPHIWSMDNFEDCLANAYLRLGMFNEAIAEYERILRINPKYPLAHYRLAQAHEGKGLRVEARANYARFLEVWKDADADIPEIVAAKRRLAS